MDGITDYFNTAVLTFWLVESVFTSTLTVFVTSLIVVCSTTLWVGQLDKRTTQQDVGSLLEEFGPIESINVSINGSVQA